MRIFLDDVRMPPDGDWMIVRSASPAMALVLSGNVTHISFDHDLGEELSGYAVACCIEAAAYYNKIPRMTWEIHSANPVGRENIRRAMENADRYWAGNHCVDCGTWFNGQAFEGAGDGTGQKFRCHPPCKEGA